MAEGWYFTSGGQQVGPVAKADLQARIAAGQVGPQDHVWRDGMPNWLPISSVPELSGGAGPADPYGQQPYAQQPHPQQQPYPQQGAYPQQGYGQPVGYGGYQAPMGPRAGAQNGKAITGFVLAIVGLLCGNIILGPIAIVLGAIAMNGMKNGDTKGKGFAIAAIIIGVLDIIEFFIGLSYLSSHPNFMRGY
jgi:hypothetical protein